MKLRILKQQYRGKPSLAHSPSPQPTARAHSPQPETPFIRPPAAGPQPPALGPRPSTPGPQPTPRNVVTKIEVRHEFNFGTKIQARHENSTSSRRSCVQKKTMESYSRNHMCKTFLQPLQSYALLALI